ncbi:MAG: SCO family protein [Kurthia sp.]|nr:SCO family protein [Candidatus Kurthia equi]
MGTSKKLIPLMLILVFILVACTSGNSFKAELDYKVSDFTYTNQDNEKVSLNDLKGKPWLAMFVFTSCTTVCPPMTANMTDLQKDFKKAGLEDYNIVAFSVDPTVDTPKKLKEYIANYDVPDPSKWTLLTGYSQADIEKFGVDSFKTLVKKTEGNDQVIHGTSFLLVDQKGTVVKSYSGVSDVPKDEILIDMESIIEDGK